MDKSRVLLSLIGYYTNGSKKEFAKMVGLSPQAISAWLTRNTYDVDLLSTKCVGVNPAYLLTGEEPMLLSGDCKTGDIQEGDKKNYDQVLDRLLSTLDRVIEQSEKNQQQFDRMLQLLDRVLSIQERTERTGNVSKHIPVAYLSECNE